MKPINKVEPTTAVINQLRRGLISGAFLRRCLVHARNPRVRSARPQERWLRAREGFPGRLVVGQDLAIVDIGPASR